MCLPADHDPGDHSGYGIFVRIFPDGSAIRYGHAGDRPYYILRAVYFYDGKGEAGGNGPFPGRSGLGPGSVEMAGIPGRDTSADPAGDPVRGTAGHLPVAFVMW